MEELFVDVGLPVDRVRAEIELGDIVTLDRDAGSGRRLRDEQIAGRPGGVFVMIEAIRAMGQSADIVAVATTQEEVGLRGAQTAAFDVQPD